MSRPFSPLSTFLKISKVSGKTILPEKGKNENPYPTCSKISAEISKLAWTAKTDSQNNLFPAS